jgi:uncharacterized protein YoxC
LFSISILALAASIAYFTYEVTRVRTDLPELLTQLEQTTQIIGPVLEQTHEITELIPPILEEVKQTRKLIPPIIDEVSELRKEIPAILHEVSETRKVIPPILDEIEATRKIIPDVLLEVKQTRQQIPPILNEVKMTRESLPILLDDANKLVDKASIAGREASQGAVTGFFSGILRAPFAIVGDIGSTVFNLNQLEKDEYTQEDLNQVYAAALELLNSEQTGAKKEIISKDGKITTKITLTDIDISGEFPCKTMHFLSEKEGRIISDKESTVCKNEEGKWDNGS